MDKTVTLQILGRKFTFKTESQLPDANQVVAYFEESLQRVTDQFSEKEVRIDNETILVLTGLNIASENHILQKNYQDLLKRMTEKSAVVLNALEKAIS